MSTSTIKKNGAHWNNLAVMDYERSQVIATFAGRIGGIICTCEKGTIRDRGIGRILRTETRDRLEKIIWQEDELKSDTDFSNYFCRSFYLENPHSWWPIFMTAVFFHLSQIKITTFPRYFLIHSANPSCFLSCLMTTKNGRAVRAKKPNKPTDYFP